MAENAKTVHVAISVDVDRFTDKYIRDNYAEMFAASGVVGVDAIRAACARMRDQGFKVFPPCNNTRPDGCCAGHSDAYGASGPDCAGDEPTAPHTSAARTTQPGTDPCHGCDMCLPTDRDGLCSRCALIPLVEVPVARIECIVCGDGAAWFNDHWDAFCEGCGYAHASGFVQVLYVAEIEARVRLANQRLHEALAEMTGVMRRIGDETLVFGRALHADGDVCTADLLADYTEGSGDQ